MKIIAPITNQMRTKGTSLPSILIVQKTIFPIIFVEGSIALFIRSSKLGGGVIFLPGAMAPVAEISLVAEAVRSSAKAVFPSSRVAMPNNNKPRLCRVFMIFINLQRVSQDRETYCELLLSGKA